MANNRQRYGFRPYRSSYGKLFSEDFLVATAYQANPGSAGAVDLNVGDPVVMANDGTVALAAAGGVCWGIITSVVQWWDSGNGWVSRLGNKIPGGTAWGTVLDRASIVKVQRVDGIQFEVDCDDAVTATTRAAYQALVGENCDLSYAGIDTTNLKAYPMLDISAHTASTAGWRIVKISDSAENVDFSGSYVKLIVECNEVQTPPAQTAGI
jgi:hypothetical protein